MIKSRAQLERFKQMVKDGKMDQKTFNKLVHATDTTRLPERVHPKKERKDDQDRETEGRSE